MFEKLTNGSRKEIINSNFSNSNRFRPFGRKEDIRKNMVQFLRLITCHTIITPTSKLGFFASIKRLFMPPSVIQ